MLVHSGFEKGRWWLDLHDGGWSYFIRRLDEYSSKGRVENRRMFKSLDDPQMDGSKTIDYGRQIRTRGQLS